jgi:hypothetical protein
LQLARDLYVANHVTARLGRIHDLATKHGFDLEA